MDTLTYAAEAEIEQSHWWFVGRRKLLAKFLSRLQIPSTAHVLDIGTSTGTNLRLLKELGFSNYLGIDLSEDAIRWCAEKDFGVVEKGDVCNLPYHDSSFKVVLATDIIEHVDDDILAVNEIRRVLEPDGYAIFTVPAFQSLWGLQDVVSHHKRRYKKDQLLALLDKCGLHCNECFYFNYLLFVPIWLARQIIKLFRVQLHSENQVNTVIINKMLTIIFKLDVSTIRYINPPFGVSIIAIAKVKTNS